MEMKRPARPASTELFGDLPAFLVEQALHRTQEVVNRLQKGLEEVVSKRKHMRGALEKHGLLSRDAALGCPQIPTTAATDGAYALERLLATDLVAAAAVAVEGLTPPSETRHWPEPRHKVFVAAEPHREDTATILRAMMLGEELVLAARAPHELVMLDGTLALPVIYFNQALHKAHEAKDLGCSQQFLARIPEYLQAYCSILKSIRSDKQFAGIPKYSTRREIGEKLGWPAYQDDRGILSLVLEAGEYTRPMPFAHPRTNDGSPTWHLYVAPLPAEVRALAEEALAALARVHVLYYKPHEGLPALRVELPYHVAANEQRLAVVLQGIRHQSAVPSMLEPYPLYLADRMAKAFARALPAFRQVAVQQVASRAHMPIENVFVALHGYRSERGR